MSAPEDGVLYNGENELPFSNTFGTQTFQADTVSRSGSEGQEAAFPEVSG